MGRRFGGDGPKPAAVVTMDFVDRLSPEMRELVNEYGLETVTTVADFINPAPDSGPRRAVEIEKLRRALGRNRELEQEEALTGNYDIADPLDPPEEQAA